MNMQEENIDKIFKEKIEKIKNIPASVKWNKNKGWANYEKDHFHLNLVSHKFLLVASFALFITICTTIIYIKLNNKSELLSFEGTDKAVNEISLKGGHKCFLAPESKIQFQNAKKADTLFLEGEGYFETSAVKPLVIIAKNTVTKCMNSKVDIRAVKQSKTTIIYALSGKINSSCAESDFPEMKIEADEKCVIYEGGIYAAKEPNTDPNFLSWKTGNLCFNNVPLAHAIKKLEEIYNVDIELKSDDVKYCRLSSEFENTSFESILEYIQCHFNTLVNRSKSSIILEGGICTD